MSIWDDIKNAINKIPGAGEVNKIGSAFNKDVLGPAVTDILGPGGINPYGNQYTSVFQAGSGVNPAPAQTAPKASPPGPGQLAEFMIGEIPKLNYGQIQNPDPQWLQQTAKLISGMSPQDAEDVLNAFPKNSPVATQLENILNPSSKQNLYGFDPLSMANMYQTVFGPAISQAQSQYMGDVQNYGKEMQQALKGASPQYQQAYAVSVPALQTAMANQAMGMQSQIAGGAATDAIINNLAQATNAAKAAGQYASIAPYYSSLINGGGLIGGSSTPASAQPLTTPFTYGAPGSAQLQTIQSQNALQQLAMAAANGQG